MLRRLRSRIPDWSSDPEKFRRINGWLTVLWLVGSIPICLFLAKSVPFLVFISVYAVVVAHLSTWQAARVEVRQDRLEQDVDDQDGY